MSNTHGQQTEKTIRNVAVHWIETPESSNIRRYGWAPAPGQIGTLAVEFVSGATYQYFNVPREVFESMQAAESQGSFLARQIKGKYEYGQV